MKAKSNPAIARRRGEAVPVEHGIPFEPSIIIAIEIGGQFQGLGCTKDIEIQTTSARSSGPATYPLFGERGLAGSTGKGRGITCPLNEASTEAIMAAGSLRVGKRKLLVVSWERVSGKKKQTATGVPDGKERGRPPYARSGIKGLESGCCTMGMRMSFTGLSS